MNGPFQVAQASGTAASGTPVRIYKLTKPLTDQAVMVNLGYDQKVKVDFSAIADEKITLVHVGEKLVILFDNHSTVTVEPVFKSRADGLGDETRDDITVEMAPGRDISLSEFANLFPISTDTSVLPTSDNDGNSNANAQASGAYFSPFSVDPFDPVPLNQLAPQEELGNFVIEIPTGGGITLGVAGSNVISEETPPPAALPTILAGLVPELVVDESFLTAATNGIPGSTPNAALTIATGVVPFIVDAPAGQQSLTLALSVSTAGVDSGLIDSQTSHHVFLFLENGEVVGREGANSAAAEGGARDFTISIDAAGTMTLTDLRSVHQGVGEQGDISEGTHLPAGLVSLTATVTDINHASASAAVDVGPFLTLLDDGPSIMAIGTGPAMSVDESFLPNGSTPDPALTVSTGDFSGAFTSVHGADGATIAYRLGVLSPGVDSGLTDSRSGESVLLTVNGGGVVEGRMAVGGDLVFTLVVDASTGVVTLSDFRAVHQGVGEDPDQSEAISLGSVANLVTLTATITDADGDNQFATIDLGKQVFLLDDGPSETAVSSGVTVALDEGNTDTGVPPTSTPATINTGAIVKGDDPDVAGSGYISHAVSAGSLVSPMSTFGADGPGSAVYGLTVDNATSGLFVTDGSAINLQLVNGVVVGVVSAGTLSGQAAFAISINHITGVVTVEQYLSLHQDSLTDTPNDSVSMLAGHLGITVVATDADNDQAIGHVDVSAQISFADDGPSVTAVGSGVTLALDEGNTDSGAPPTSTPATINTGGIVQGDDPDVAGTGYISHAVSVGALVTPTIAFGADGPAAAGSIAYALTVTNAASGLFVTDGAAINLVDINGDGSVIVGVVQAGSTFVGEAAFAISISATGVVTVEQYLSLHQPITTDPNDVVFLQNGSLAVTVTVTDGDGDKASAPSDVSAQISFADDGPTAPVLTLTPGALVAHDETDGIQHVAGVSTDILGSTSIAFNGAANTIAGLFTTVALPGNDPDVSHDAAAPGFAIGYAASELSNGTLGSLFAVAGGSFGADGPGTTVFKLVLGAAVSGVTLTDGAAITLSLDAAGRVIGTVGADAVDNTLTGKTAFAIAIDQTTGELYVAQYLSLHNPDTTNPNEPVNLANGAVQVQATITDGDGDTATSNILNIGAEIGFRDDAPTAPTLTLTPGAFVAHDETASIQNVAGVSTDILGSTLVTFNGTAGTSIASIFSTVALPGSDPDVSHDAAAPGFAIGYAASELSSGTLGSLFAVAGGSFGADGPGTTKLALTISAPGVASGVTLTDGTTITLSVDAAGRVIGTVGADAVDNTLTGKTAFAIAIDQTTGELYVAQYLSLHNPDTANPNEPVNLANGAVQVQATITDGDGDTATSNILNIGADIGFRDDAPTAPTLTLTPGALVAHDETGGIQHVAGVSTDILGSTSIAFNGAANTIAGLFTTVALPGNDPDVSHDAAAPGFAIGYAASELSNGTLGSLFAVAGGSFGADGPGTTVFKLVLGAAVSGVTLTDGAAITLSLDAAGRVIGTVGADAVDNTLTGKTAFAIAIDQTTGELYVAQYLSLHNPDTTNPNEPVNLTDGAVQVQATITDGDGDTATSNILNIGAEIGFRDDAPTAPTLTLTPGAFVAHDETASIQNVAGVSTDILGSTLVTFNGTAGTSIASIFSTVALPGSDPDVSHDAAAPGFAIGYAASELSSGTLGSLFAVAGGSFGADGPGTTKLALTISAPGVASGVTLTDGTTITLSVDAAGRVIGTVGADAVDNTLTGKTAFAIAIDQTTGELYVAQYLSLHNPDTANPNEPVNLANGAVQVQATITDGDGDTATSNVLNIGAEIGFRDDAPTAPTLTLTPGALVAHDETGGIQHVAGVSTDILGSTSIAFNGAANTIAGLFTTVALPGNDPDVSHDAAAPGFAIGYAASELSSGTLGSLFAVAGGSFGADGPGTTKLALTISAPGVASGVTLTDGTTITLSVDAAGRVIGTVGADAVDNTLTGKTAFAIAIDQTTGELYVAQYLSLHNPDTANPNEPVNLANGAVQVQATITDGDGDTATSNVLNIGAEIGFRDDAPTAPTLTLTPGALVAHDETGGIQHVAGVSTDILGSTSITFNGAANTIAGLFTTVALPGSDPDVSHDVGGAIGYAASELSNGTLGSLFAAAGGSFGADGPGTTVFKLVLGAAASGVTLTDGTTITLSVDGSGRVIGTVGADAVDNTLTGKTAFAIAIDQTTGELYVAQYLSLHNPDTTNPNEPVNLTDGAVQVQATITDGDGDTAVSNVLNIGAEIGFRDDAPTAPTLTLTPGALVAHDETGGIQHVAGVSTDILGSTSITFNGAANTIAGLFTTVALPGSDPDVSHDVGGAIGYAASELSSGTLGSLFAVAGGSFGTDGAGTTVFKLVLGAAASGVTLTDGAAITLSLDAAGRVIGTVGADAVDNTLTGKTAFAIAIDQTTGELYVAQYLSLHNPDTTNPNEPVNLANGAVQVQATITDGDGDTATSNILNIGAEIGFRDDAPTAPTLTLTPGAFVAHDETASIQNVAGVSTDILGSTSVTFNGVVTTIAGIFSSIPAASLGNDPDVPHDVGGAIGYALSETSNGTVNSVASLITAAGGSFGADGAGTTVFKLVLGAAASGVTLTDGTTITLSVDAAGRVIGTVGADAVDNTLTGKTAFAIAIDQTTGELYVAQYLSLHNPDTANPNEPVNLANGAVQVQATITDGDGDTATSNVLNIGAEIGFRDDAPTAPAVTVSDGSVAVDETPGVQTAADPNPANDVLSTALPAAILVKFDAIGAARGVDTDVAPILLDDGALSFAASSGSLVSLGTRNFGADGPAGGTAASGTSYSLKVTTAGIFSGLQTTEGHDVFLYLQTTGPMAGLILGRVGIEASSTPGLDTPDPNGKVAFALAIDPASGKVYIADYLSLHNPIAGSTPAAYDDQINLAPNTVGVVVTLTDGDGDTISTSGTDVSSRIRFQDDGPTAHVDANAAQSGQTVTGNVETNDTAGADGIASIAWSGASGSTVTGTHGVLTFNGTGGYSYHANANTTSGTDVFNYTITDGDGDTSPSTLTITVTNGQPSVSPASATVNEAALDRVTDPGDLGHGTVTGSNPASTAETTTGTLTFSDPDAPVTVTGVAAGNVGSAVGNVGTNVTGSYGLLHVNADGSYTYTLTSPYHTSPDANNGPNTEPARDVFTFTVTDGLGNTSSSTISISIIDDVPTARVDSGNVNEGALLTVAASGVLSNDVAGADGFAAGGGVVGVRAAGGDLTTDVTTGVNTPIAGLHGTLHLNADGGYTYQSTANNITANTTDVFVYTIKDGDGDLSTTTLTINLANVTLVADNQTKTVNEAALDTVTDPGDLGHGTVTGSNPTSPAETVTGALAVAGATGYVAQSVTGTHGLFQLNADGSYTYTLTSPVTESPASNNGADTVNGVESFSYTAHDASNNTVTGTITINVIDDVPTAHVDVNAAQSGQTVTGNVETNDTAGADGIASIAWAGAVGNTVTLAHGVLTFNATGGYSYHANANTTSGTDVFNYTITDGDGDTSPSTLTITVTNGQPSVSPASATVNEAALDRVTDPGDLGHGTVTGSNPASTAETTTGTLTFSDPDAPVTVTGVAAGNVGSAVGNVGTNVTGSYGLLHVNADGSYTYTLTSPYHTSPDANNGPNTEPARDVFTFTVTDGLGNTSSSTISISIIDDVPTARVDSGNVNEGALLTVAASGVLSNDVAGADGFAAGGGVVGVRAAGGDLTTDVTTGVNTPIAGLHGTLHLNADGGYTYQSTANNITANTTDVFVYTIKDGDGDLSTTTLTINLANVTLVADNQTKTVNEAALDTVTDPGDLGHGTVTGSNPTSPAETVTGALAVAGATGYVAQSVTGTHGLFQLNADGSYTYTLTSPVTESPASNNGADTVNGVESFSYTAHDASNNTVTGTITINVIDDVPTAHVDVNAAQSGQTVTGNVETNDTAGADGIASIAWAGAVGNTVTLAHGVLTFNATGGYSYHANANTTSGTDVFNYTITDGDGDTSPSTLTITVTNGQPSVSPASATVNEAALDRVTDPGDLGHGTVTGSNPASTAETTTGTLTFSDPDAPVTVTGVAAGNVGSAVGNVGTNVTGSYGLLHVNADGSYTYTLTSPYHTSPDANNGPNTEPARDVFTFTVTDGLGNTSSSTISISIIDDVPTARVDSGNVNEGALLTVAASGVLSNDVAGADGFAAGGGVVGVRAAGGDLTTDVTTGVNTPIAGLHGTLHLNADGGYTYQSTANNITANTTDVFVYTIKDGDGDLSTTTLTINLANVTLVADNQTKTVNEAALDTVTDPGDLGHGTVTGSNPTSPAETVTGALAVAGATGYVAQSVTGTHGLFQLNADGTYTYTLTSPVTESPASNNGADTVNGVESFSYTAHDASNNTVTGTITINVIDDVPIAPTVTVSDGSVAVDETPGVQTAAAIVGPPAVPAETDVLGSSPITFNGAASMVATLFSSIANKGTDSDVPAGSLDNGALSFASSGAASIVTLTGGAYGADGAGTTLYTLTVTNPTPAGLTLTDGTAITLSLDGSGRVIGTVSVDAANPVLGGQAALAIAIDPATGQLYVAQYLSLHQDSANNTSNDFITLAMNTVGVTVRLTDGDGDQVASAVSDISGHISFFDDGPSKITPRPAVLTNGSGSNTEPLDIVDTNTDNNYGADGGTVIFSASLNGQDSGLTSSARKIFYQTSNSGHTLTGYADQNLNGVYDPTVDTTAIFTINLNLDKSLTIASDTYTVQMLHTVDSATHIDFNNGGYNFVGGNNSWTGFVPVGETLVNPIDNNSPDLLLTPSVNHQLASTINSDANSGGVGPGGSVGQAPGGGVETFRVDFVTDLSGNPADSGQLNYANPANRDHVFDGHYTVDGSTADFTATSGSTINFAAFDDPDGNNIVGDGAKETITGVVIRFGASRSLQSICKDMNFVIRFGRIGCGGGNHGCEGHFGKEVCCAAER